MGLYGEPTVVNNVETLSNVPWIVANGGRAFAALGQGRSTGTRLFALVRPGAPPRRLRARDGAQHVPRPHLRPRARRRDDRRRRDQGLHPRRRLGPVVRTRPLDVPLGQDEVAEHGSMLGSGSIVVLGEHDCVGARGVADHQVLPARVLRAVHAVPRGCRLARADPAPHRVGRRAPRGRRPPARRLRQHRARARLAAAADDDLPARPLDPVVDRLGDLACARTSSSRTSTRGGARMADDDTTTVPFTLDGRPATRAPRRGGDRRGRAGGHVRPALLLSPADGAGRGLPHVPRRDRRPPRADPPAGLLRDGDRGHDTSSRTPTR